MAPSIELANKSDQEGFVLKNCEIQILGKVGECDTFFKRNFYNRLKGFETESDDIPCCDGYVSNLFETTIAGESPLVVLGFESYEKDKTIFLDTVIRIGLENGELNKMLLKIPFEERRIGDIKVGKSSDYEDFSKLYKGLVSNGIIVGRYYDGNYIYFISTDSVGSQGTDYRSRVFRYLMELSKKGNKRSVWDKINNIINR